MKKRNAEFGLDCFDLMTYGTDCNVQFLRRFPKVSMSGGRFKDRERLQ